MVIFALPFITFFSSIPSVQNIWISKRRTDTLFIDNLYWGISCPFVVYLRIAKCMHELPTTWLPTWWSVVAKTRSSLCRFARIAFRRMSHIRLISDRYPHGISLQGSPLGDAIPGETQRYPQGIYCLSFARAPPSLFKGGERETGRKRADKDSVLVWDLLRKRDIKDDARMIMLWENAISDALGWDFFFSQKQVLGI